MCMHHDAVLPAAHDDRRVVGEEPAARAVCDDGLDGGELKVPDLIE